MVILWLFSELEAPNFLSVQAKTLNNGIGNGITLSPFTQCLSQNPMHSNRPTQKQVGLHYLPVHKLYMEYYNTQKLNSFNKINTIYLDAYFNSVCAIGK